MLPKTIFFIIATLVLTEGITIDCEYSVKNLWFAPNFYHCQARIIAVGHPRDVTKVSSNHLANYNHLNVSSIDFTDQVVRLPPRKLEQFFPNIAAYRLLKTQTEVIHPNDINKLPELKYYTCETNPITNIPPNMFADNPKLVGIYIYGGNKIEHVAYNVFDHLKQLKYLQLQGPCLTFVLNNNRAAVEAQLFKISQACPPTLDMLNEQLSQRNCDCGDRE